MRITLPSGTPAEWAEPVGAAPALGVVVVTDIWGLRPLFDDLCARLAADLPAAVCAPEPFPGRDLGTDIEARQEAMVAKRDDETLGDLQDAAALLRERGCTHIGLIGFCMGGMYCHKAAPTGAFDRIASFYGMIRLPERWSAGPGQGEPLEALARGGADRVLAVVGGIDAFTPPADVDALEATGVTVVRYPAADHGFVHDPARPAHRPADAADAWARAEAWLRGA